MVFNNIKARREQRKQKRIRRRMARSSPYSILNFEQLSNIDARNHLLANASCYYEFPMVEFEHPPSNNYLDYWLVHAFQKAGFEATSHTNFHQIRHNSDSDSEIPFEGVIRGREFGKKKKVPIFWFFLAGITVIGIIIPIIVALKRRKKIPYMATISYWGINKYSLPNLAEVIGPLNIGENELDLGSFGTILRYAANYHPIRTYLHIAIGFELKPRHFVSEDKVIKKFELLKTKIQEALGTVPVLLEYRGASQEIDAKPLFAWRKKKLKDIHSRFPLK